MLLNNKEFEIPTHRTYKDLLTIEPLREEHTEEDYKYVMQDREFIRKTRGGGAWPEDSLTLHENRIDLAWHQRVLENRKSFAYLVRDIEGVYIGCFYMYPPGLRSDWSDTYDVDVNFSLHHDGRVGS